LAIRVDDLGSLLAQVESAGGAVETPISESMTAAVIRDPDGNTIEVLQG